MRRFRLRLLWRVNCEALMRAAGQNLKRLLKKRDWGRRPWPAGAANAAFCLQFCFLLLCSWLLETSFWVDLGIGTERLMHLLLPANKLFQRIFQQADLL